MSGPSGLGRSATVMAAGTAVSRLLGMVRAAVLAGAIGVNAAGASAFGVANWLPNMLYMLIAGGVLNAVLVPQLVRAYRTAGGQDYVDRLLSVSLALLGGVTLLLTAAAPLVVRVVSSGADPDFWPLATAFAYWCVPQVFFYGLYTLLGQVLNAQGRFGAYMWAPVVNNLVSIAGFAAFIVTFGRYRVDGPLAEPSAWTAGPVAWLGATATAGIVVQALVLLWPLRRAGFRFRPRRDWRGAGLGTAGRVAGWTFAALLAGQVGVMVVTRISTLAGQVSENAPDVANNAAYTGAFSIFMLPHSLVTVSLLTALFTTLSTHAAAGDTPAARRVAGSGLRTTGVFTVLATAVLAVLALPVVRVALPTITPAEAGSIAPVVVALVLGLVPLGAWSLVQRVHYAYEDARGLFRIQLAMAAVVAGGTMLGWLLLPVQWWTAAAGAAITASYLLGSLWGGWGVRRRLGGTGRTVVGLHLRAGGAAALAAAVGWPTARLFGDQSRLDLVQAVGVCVLVGCVMLAVYVGLLHLMRVAELAALTRPVASMVRRSMGAVARVRRPGPSRPRTEGVPVDVAVGQGTMLAQRYRLEHPMPCDLPGTEAWVARDQILDRTVRALLLRSGRVHQAQDAARRAALVTDERLLRVLDVGDHDGLAYVVTERLPGRDLAQLTAHGPLPADQARAVIGEAAVALEVARRRGVHHLALRPSAVHVTPQGRVVVSGLALDGELSEHGLGDARSTTRADTVGLVQLLYLALTGRWPAATGAGLHGVPPAPLMGGRPVAPAEIAAGVPNDLDTLCAVTLGPFDDGPHSPAELVRELEPWGTVTVVEPALPRPRKPSREADTAVDTPPITAETQLGAPAGEGDLVADSAVVATEGEGTPAEDVSDPEGDADPGLVDDDSDTRPDDDTDPRPDTDLRPDTPDDDAWDDDGVWDDDLDESRGEPEAAAAGDRPVVRRSVLGAGPSVPARPGTPPPAIQPSALRPDPRTAASATPSARVTAPVPGGAPGPARTSVFATVPGPEQADGHRPGQPPRPQHPEPEHHPFDEIIGGAADLLVRKRFNATPLVLLLVVALIVAGTMWAWRAFAPDTLDLGGLLGDAPAETAVPETPAPTPAPVDPGATPAPPTGPVPVIAGAAQVDPPPDGDNNEHPELVALAVDGDPATQWLSRTYASPTYGMKSGIGYAVTFAEPATVTQVTLLTTVTGGNVELRATTPEAPTEGEVLASGPLSATTVLTLAQPTQASSLVLWFTALPQAADGRNRVELSEVQVG